MKYIWYSPEKVNILYLLRLLHILISISNALIMEANTVNPGHTAPESSLIQVHIVCNICFQRTQAEEKMEEICCEWWEKG